MTNISSTSATTRIGTHEHASTSTSTTNNQQPDIAVREAFQSLVDAFGGKNPNPVPKQYIDALNQLLAQNSQTSAEFTENHLARSNFQEKEAGDNWIIVGTIFVGQGTNTPSIEDLQVLLRNIGDPDKSRQMDMPQIVENSLDDVNFAIPINQQRRLKEGTSFAFTITFGESQAEGFSTTISTSESGEGRQGLISDASDFTSNESLVVVIVVVIVIVLIIILIAIPVACCCAKRQGKRKYKYAVDGLEDEEETNDPWSPMGRQIYLKRSSKFDLKSNDELHSKVFSL